MPDMSPSVVNPAGHPARVWFESPHGRALLESEQAQVEAALRERPALAWLWLAPLPGPARAGGECRSPASDDWERAERFALPFSLPAESVGTLVLHLGSVRFRYLSGWFRYTMDAREGAELIDLAKPEHVIPVHYEGWSHFQQDRPVAEPVLAGSSYADRITWLDPGESTSVEV